MKVLIADDEDYTREGLIDSIAWKSLGIEEVMQARNGLEALHLSQWFKPDIVLTDIKMPKLNGIQFVRELVTSNPLCKVIFMSGYMEIEYLKSAIELSVVDYIEKPININGIEKAMRKAINEILEKEKNKKITQNQKELQQEKLANLLIIKEYDRMGIELLCKEVGFPDDKYYCCMAVYEQAPFSTADERIQKIQKFFERKGLNSLCRIIKENTFIVIIAYNNQDKYRIGAICQQFLDYFSTTTMGVGFEAENMRNIYNSYQTAQLALNLSFYNEKERLFFVDDDIMIRRFITPGIFGEFIKILKENPYDLREWNERLFEDLKKSKYYRKEQVQTLLASLITEIFKQYPDLNTTHNDAELYEDISKAIHGYQFLSEIRAYIYSLIDKLEEKCSRESSYSRVIKGTIDYISANYSNPDLSITMIADYVNFTSTYLNVLFKQEMKVTLKQYLSNYRLEKAKCMLENDFYKITDIAEKCGYANANYFAKVFKETTGMTPVEYRNCKS